HSLIAWLDITAADDSATERTRPESPPTQVRLDPRSVILKDRLSLPGSADIIPWKPSLSAGVPQGRDVARPKRHEWRPRLIRRFVRNLPTEAETIVVVTDAGEG